MATLPVELQNVYLTLEMCVVIVIPLRTYIVCLYVCVCYFHMLAFYKTFEILVPDFIPNIMFISISTILSTGVSLSKAKCLVGCVCAYVCLPLGNMFSYLSEVVCVVLAFLTQVGTTDENVHEWWYTTADGRNPAVVDRLLVYGTLVYYRVCFFFVVVALCSRFFFLVDVILIPEYTDVHVMRLQTR